MAFYGSRIGAASPGGAVGRVFSVSGSGASSASSGCDPAKNKPNQFCCGSEPVTVSCTEAYKRGFSDKEAEDYCDALVDGVFLGKFGAASTFAKFTLRPSA